MSNTPVEQRKRAAIYTRISEDKTGERAGVDRQLQDCAALAGRLGWTVVDTFDDNDISAYSGKRRPGFEDLLDAMSGGRVAAVLCWDLTRLYRSMRDLERFIEIAEAASISIKTVQAGELDLSTSAGRMVARILGSVARQESEHHGERRRRACMQKAQLGRWETANRPFGYTMSGRPKEPEAQAIRDAVRDVLEGKSIQQVARQWNAAGLTTTRGVAWRSPRLRRVLVNPRYAGLKVHRGKVVQGVTGDWTRLIDPDTHDRLVAYLGDPSRITNTTSWERRYPGSGIYRCGVCGGPMKSHRSGGRDRLSYVCRNGGHVGRNATRLDDFVANVILERLGLPDANLLIAACGVDVGALQDRRAELMAKYEELSTLLIDGVLDGPKVRENAAKLKSQIARVDGNLAAATRVSPAAAMLASGEDLRQRWERMDPTLRSQVIDELVVVRVLPSRRGRGFDPASVDISWRADG